jgi:hypothetical protein
MQAPYGKKISEKFQPDFSWVSRHDAQDAVCSPAPIRQLSRIAKREDGDDGTPNRRSEVPPDYRSAAQAFVDVAP